LTVRVDAVGQRVAMLKLGGDGEHAETREHETRQEGHGLHGVEHTGDGDDGPGDDKDRAASDAKAGHAASFWMAGAAVVAVRPPPLAPIAGGDCGARN
jgi:hypothetical protein